MKIKISLILIIIICIQLLNSCKFQPLKEYPNFLKDKELIQNGILQTDILIYERGNENTIIVDLIDCKSIGKELSEYIVQYMGNKGYRINHVSKSSIGYLLNEKVYAKVIETEEQKILDFNKLPLRKAPFYFDTSKAERDILELINIEKVNTDTINDNQPFDVYMLILINASKVSTGETLAEGFLTALLSMGTVSAYRISKINADLLLFNTKTKKLIWNDFKEIEGYYPDVDNVISAVESMLEKIPDKNK